MRALASIAACCAVALALLSQPATAADTRFAPYMDTSLSQRLPDAAKGAGLNHVTLAFALAGSGCTATWNGSTPIDGGFYQQDIAAFRAAGGDVTVSFGGANGTELAQACSSASALQAQYQAMIDRYQLTSVDFDVEGAAVADSVSVDRRNQAIAGLERANSGLRVSYTLPALPSGLTGDGMNVLRSAVKNGARVDVVNVMAMDYGGAAPPDQMGKNAIDAGTALLDQLGQLYPSKSTAARWAMVGVTPMIGINDVAPEVFTLQDAQQLATWAHDHAIGQLSMWSLGRDAPCPSGQNQVSPTCSGVSQQSWAFSKALA
jgi:hypothetical protein